MILDKKKTAEQMRELQSICSMPISNFVENQFPFASDEFKSNKRPKYKIKIESQFTCASPELVMTLSKIEKVLLILERQNNLPENNINLPTSDQSETTAMHNPDQYEFEQLFETGPEQNQSRNTDNVIDFAENVRILSMITEEIIELLAKQDSRIAVREIDEATAVQFASYAKELLSEEVFALATKKSIQNQRDHLMLITA